MTAHIPWAVSQTVCTDTFNPSPLDTLPILSTMNDTTTTLIDSQPPKVEKVEPVSATPAASSATLTQEKKKGVKTAPPAGHAAGIQAPIDVPRWRFWIIFSSVRLKLAHSTVS